MIVTDSGANIKKAFSTRFISKTSPVEEISLIIFEDSEDSVSSDEFSDLLIPSVTETPPDTETAFVNSIRCSAHTLQLVLHDVINSRSDDSCATSALAKVKRLARLCNKSHALSYSNSGSVPPRSCPTRWNSDFQLVKHVLQHVEQLNNALLKTK